MSARQKQLLWALLAAGLLARLIWNFVTYGLAFDVDSYGLVAQAIDDHGLSFYGAVNEGEPVPRWPYPSGFVPWIEVSQRLDRHLGLPFEHMIQVPSILADIGIAWLVQHHLGWRGASGTVRLVAAGAVALGPAFAYVSGYHGQIDAVAILPGLAAVVLWERRADASRALWAGLLIGAGAAVKTVPGFLVLALLPTARSWRERILLVGTAVAVPLVLLAPFLAKDYDGVRESLSYSGRPGLGGISMLVQPGLVENWFHGERFEYNAASEWLRSNASAFTTVAVLAAGLVAYVRRMPAPEAACLVWLAVFAFGASWFPWYVVWGLPFFLLVSVRAALALQVAVLIPMTLVYFGGDWLDQPQYVYFPIMLAVWVAVLAAATRLAVAAPARR